MKLLRYFLVVLMSAIPALSQIAPDTGKKEVSAITEINKQTPLDLYKYSEKNKADFAYHYSHSSHSSHSSHRSHSSHYSSRF